MKRLIFILFSFLISSTQAQKVFQHDVANFMVEWEGNDTSYTSFKDPFWTFHYDSVYNILTKDSVGPVDHHWFYSRLLNSSWIEYKPRKDEYLLVDPYFDMRVGPEFGSLSNQDIWRYKRGVMLRWKLNSKFKVYSVLSEHRLEPEYYENLRTENSRVVSGEGGSKLVENQRGQHTVLQSLGAAEYSPNKHMNFAVGHGKNFIGDGYRSLFLSDLATSYPYFKANFKYWKFNYTSVVAEFIDLPSDIPGDGLRQKKYGSFHYLDMSITKNWQVGLFESVIWGGDSLQRFSFDLNYLNPFAVMRPLEFNLGSPDNMLIGFSSSLKLGSSYKLYYQFILDELLSRELIAGNGWWANKYGVQLGARVQNPNWFKNFTGRAEFNWVRPFTYSHKSSIESYAHMNQALAHPLGANFYEILLHGAYKYKRWLIQYKTNYYQAGKETNDSTSIGADIQRSYNTRLEEYDNTILQGNLTSQWLNEFKLSWCLNPANFMFLDLGIFQRNIWQDGSFSQQHHILVGVRTSFLNHYYDY